MQSTESLYFVLIISFFVVYTLKKFGVLQNLDVLFLSKDKKWELKNFFSKHFHYFNQLSEEDRQQFIIRAYKLAKNLKIIGRQDFEITEQVKLYVVSAQVQLTFGFDRYYFPKFRTILVYPDAYRNKITGNMHYGEVNPRGIIVLSWKRLVKGHAIPNDKINLGLHEMAHALMHTIIHSNDHETGLDPLLSNVVKLSQEEIVKIKSSDHHFFRDYAGTNIFEFFAIAIEYFFEVPEELNKELPKLYKYLTDLLKQDPARKIFRN